MLLFRIFIHTKYKRMSKSFPVDVDVFVNPQFVAPEDGFNRFSDYYVWGFVHSP